MFKLKSISHQADSFFVMLLFFLFALTAFILVLIGVKQYKSTANAMNYNYEVRTVTSYLREKVRQNDSDAAISVETINGTKALCLKNTINDIVYNTFIYYRMVPHTVWTADKGLSKSGDLTWQKPPTK